MFKNKVRLIDKNWNDIKTLKIKNRPFEGDFIYLNDIYYKVIKVIHSMMGKYELLIVIEQVKN